MTTKRSTLAAVFMTVAFPIPVLAEQSYPIVIEHALGTTTIAAKPERVATVAWANHEVPLALGIVPVGMPSVSWGDDDEDGTHIWTEAKLEELGAQVPPLFDEGDGIDFEAVAETNPDVILAAYSGLTQEEYDTLSQIAPVVAYPKGPWTTDWRTTVRLNSAGMGMAEEGEALIAKLEADISNATAKYPGLADETVMFISHSDASDLSTINFYSANDPRVQFFEELGMNLAEAVAETRGTDSYSGSFSSENIDTFDDVTVVVTYGGDELQDAMTADPLTSKMPAVQDGAFVKLVGDPLGAAASPSPLSLPMMIDDYVRLLATASGAN